MHSAHCVVAALAAFSTFVSANAGDGMTCNLQPVEVMEAGPVSEPSLFNQPIEFWQSATTDMSRYPDLPPRLARAGIAASKLGGVLVNDVGQSAIAQALWALGLRTKPAIKLYLEAFPHMEVAEQQRLLAKGAEYLDLIFGQKISAENVEMLGKYASTMGLEFSSYARVMKEYKNAAEDNEVVQYALLFMMEDTKSGQKAMLDQVMAKLPSPGTLGFGKRDAVLIPAGEVASKEAFAASSAKQTSEKTGFKPLKLSTGFFQKTTAWFPESMVNAYQAFESSGKLSRSETIEKLYMEMSAYAGNGQSKTDEELMILLQVLKKIVPANARSLESVWLTYYSPYRDGPLYKRFVDALFDTNQSVPSPQTYKAWLNMFSSKEWLQPTFMDDSQIWKERALYFRTKMRSRFPDSYTLDGPIQK